MTELWLNKYNIAENYYKEHGNLNVPRNYSVKVNNRTFNLGVWLNTQRCKYKGTVLPMLDNEQIKLLEKIGMVWSLESAKKEKEYEHWLNVYNLVKKYYEKYGNLYIPIGYIEFVDDEHIDLVKWLFNQKAKYNKKINSVLSDEQIKLLEEIGMNWDMSSYKQEKDPDYISDKWYFKYELAKEYYKKHGNLLINSTYKVSKDNEVIKLGVWINSQRKRYKGKTLPKLNELQIKLLEEIDMVWSFDNTFEDDWNRKYKLAKKYYEEHGNLLITQKYVVNNENEEVNLGTWINTQRMRYKGKYKPKLEQYQIELLEQIGMMWEINEFNKENLNIRWLKNYELAKKYYEEHGNLLIPSSYIVKIDNKEVNLGTWITTQRMRYKGKSKSKLEQYQIELLEEIGMVWNILEYKDICKFIEEQYILYEQNKLSENDIIKLLEDGVFVYSDSDEIQKANTLEYYRKNK